VNRSAQPQEIISHEGVLCWWGWEEREWERKAKEIEEMGAIYRVESFFFFVSSFLSTAATSAWAFKTSYPSLLHKSILINPISSHPISYMSSTIIVIYSHYHYFLNCLLFFSNIFLLFIIFLNYFTLPHLISFLSFAIFCHQILHDT